MTLSTDIYILNPADPKAVFRFMQESLTPWDDDGGYRSPDQMLTDHTPGKEYANRVGQGLPAILSVYYKDDGVSLVKDTDHDDYCNFPGNEYYDDSEEICNGQFDSPKHYVRVNLDTSYGAEFPGGFGCSELHAALIIELSYWLQAAEIKFAWRNEYTSEIFYGLEGLVTLTNGGKAAGEWFSSVVLPALSPILVSPPKAIETPSEGFSEGFTIEGEYHD